MNFWRAFIDDLIQEKRPKEAREYLEARLTPYSDPMLLDLLGTAQKDMNDPEAAERTWRESIRRDPSRMNPYMRLGSMLLALKRFPEAIEALERAVAVSPRLRGGELSAVPERMTSRGAPRMRSASGPRSRRSARTRRRSRGGMGPSP